MSISYVITNDEELATLEELGTLKNEIEKRRLLRKQGKQNQDYLLEKQFNLSVLGCLKISLLLLVLPLLLLHALLHLHLHPPQQEDDLLHED